MEKERSPIKSRLTLARLAVIYEGRNDDDAKEKKRVQYRMTQFHRDMLDMIATDAGINQTVALRSIINEWFELKRIQALQDE